MPKEQSYHPDDGGKDKPYYSGDVRMGRNAELSDDFTLRRQAAEAIAKSRKSATGKMSDGSDVVSEPSDKTITDPPLSV